MSQAFKDHFSGHASDYRAYRPRYPAALPALLAAAAPSRRLAWDCGCGNGQLSVGLATVFDAVAATDASATQIANADAHPNVHYRQAAAEASGLEDGSVDLIVAAQAAHWFDLEAFYAEAARVARPGAALALICYGVLTLGAAMDPLVDVFYRDTIGAYWPPERRHVDTGYRDLAFPFPELTVPPLSLEADWSLSQLAGYLGTWSAVQRAATELGANPVDALVKRLAPLWGTPEEPRPIRWPLSIRLGRLPGEEPGFPP